MSLPGLQLSASDEPVLSAVVHHLTEGSEWRFEVAFGSTVEIKVGTRCHRNTLETH